MQDDRANTSDSTEAKPELTAPRKEKIRWLDNKENVAKLVYTLYTLAVLLFLADFFYHKHTYFDFENWPGFYALFGFVSYTGLIFLAIRFRRLVKRDENYYDR